MKLLVAAVTLAALFTLTPATVNAEPPPICSPGSHHAFDDDSSGITLRYIYEGLPDGKCRILGPYFEANDDIFYSSPSSPAPAPHAPSSIPTGYAWGPDGRLVKIEPTPAPIIVERVIVQEVIVTATPTVSASSAPSAPVMFVRPPQTGDGGVIGR